MHFVSIIRAFIQISTRFLKNSLICEQKHFKVDFFFLLFWKFSLKFSFLQMCKIFPKGILFFQNFVKVPRNIITFTKSFSVFKIKMWIIFPNISPYLIKFPKICFSEISLNFASNLMNIFSEILYYDFKAIHTRLDLCAMRTRATSAIGAICTIHATSHSGHSDSTRYPQPPVRFVFSSFQQEVLYKIWATIL